VAKFIMDLSASGCFGTSIGTKHAVLFTLFTRGQPFAHGTALSLSIWRIDLGRYPLARVQAAPELPEALYLAFGFGGCVVPIEPGSAAVPNYYVASKMPQR
jgi:hypothetical protein